MVDYAACQSLVFLIFLTGPKPGSSSNAPIYCPAIGSGVFTPWSFVKILETGYRMLNAPQSPPVSFCPCLVQTHVSSSSMLQRVQPIVV